MDCEEERSNSNCERKRRRRSSFWAVLSCFGGDADQKRLAVVPVETSGGESDQKSSCRDAIGGKKEGKKEMNCRKSFKVLRRQVVRFLLRTRQRVQEVVLWHVKQMKVEFPSHKNNMEIKMSKKISVNKFPGTVRDPLGTSLLEGLAVEYKFPNGRDKSKGNNAPTKPQSIQEITIVHHVASNLKIKTEPAPLYRILDPVQTQTQTRTSHPGSPEPVNQPALREVHEESLMKNGYGPWMGLFVLTLALALMVLGGLTVGVICMCVWFSVLYMLRPGTVPEEHGTSEKPEEIDVNSEEYKKMVVLRGFLERDKSKSMKETIGDGV